MNWRTSTCTCTKMTDQVLIEWKKLFWVEIYPFVFIAKKKSSRCNSSLHKKIYVIKKISKNKPNNEHDKISYFCEKMAIAHIMYPLIARHLRKSHFMSNLQIHVFCKWLSCSLQRSDWWYCLLADCEHFHPCFNFITETYIRIGKSGRKVETKWRWRGSVLMS